MAADTYQVGGAHYKQMGVSPWDVVGGWPVPQQIGFYRGNTVKYALRLDAGKADMLEEAEKLAHYAQKLVEVLRQQRDAEKKDSSAFFVTPQGMWGTSYVADEQRPLVPTGGVPRPCL